MFTALLPGSFNPPTRGHLKLIERASSLCNALHVGVGYHLEKSKRLLSIEETVELLKEATAHLSNVSIHSFTGLTISFAKKLGAHFLIRGLRDYCDLAYEKQLAIANFTLEMETLFLTALPETSEISSSLIRELVHNGAPLDQFLPKVVLDAITRRSK